MNSHGVSFDLGFVPSVLRGAIGRYSRECWALYGARQENCPVASEAIDPEFECDPSKSQTQMNLDPTNGGSISPEEIFWFLKYINEDAEQAVKGVLLHNFFSKRTSVF